MSNELTAVQMEEVVKVFRESFSHVLKNNVGESRDTVITWVGNIILREKPHLLLTPLGIDHAQDLVFSQTQNISDFILGLSFVFFSRLGYNDAHYCGLVENLAKGVSTHGENVSNFNSREPLIPTVILERLITRDEAKSILAKNKWLIIMLLLSLCINYADFEKYDGKKKPVQG